MARRSESSRSVSMAHRVGVFAARVVAQVAAHGGDLEASDLVDAVYEKLNERYGKIAVELDTDINRVEDAIYIAIQIEKGL